MVAESKGDGSPSQPEKPRPRVGATGEKFFYLFMPQPGITPDQLAISMELIEYGLGVVMTDALAPLARFGVAVRVLPKHGCDLLYEAMDEETKGHWRAIPLSKVAVAQKPKGLQLPPGAMG